jgi:predicted Zn-dependent peptidase
MEIIGLKNGIRLVLMPLKGFKAVTVEVHVKIGAKYESKTEAGLSHFLEHMAFKGTVKRPSPTGIFQEMDSKGADFNAETGYENTSYRITTIRSNLEWAVEMLSDIIFASQMPEEEVEKERGVIAEEIKMYQDNPMMGMGEELVKFLYGGSPIGCWNISGEIGDINGVSRQNVADYRNKYFAPQRMVVVVAGNVNLRDSGLLTKYFNQKVSNNTKLPIVEIKLNPVKLKTEQRSVEQAHFAVAVPTFGTQDERRYAMKILDVVLAGNTSSRLFEEVRSKKGWAYYVFPVGENIKEAGYWGVQAGVAEDKLDSAIELVEKEILTIESWLKQPAIDRAKAYFGGKIELMLDRSNFWTSYVGHKLLLEDRLVDPIEELKKIRGVQLNEVLELAKTFFVKVQIRKYIVSRQGI